MTQSLIFDVTDESFERDVIAKSKELPVVVDFWAAWCGPCRLLGPVLEAAISQYAGKILLAKIDTDANPETSYRFGIQSIPAVKVFRDGAVVGGFIGYRGEKDVETFLRSLVPSEADEICVKAESIEKSGDFEGAVSLYNDVLAKEPRHAKALLGLGTSLAALGNFVEAERTLLRIPVDTPEEAEAGRLIARFKLRQESAGIPTETEARTALVANPDDREARYALATRLAANQQHDEAFEHFLVLLKAPEFRERARESIVRLFDVLGPQDPRVRDIRIRMAKVLY